MILCAAIASTLLLVIVMVKDAGRGNDGDAVVVRIVCMLQPFVVFLTLVGLLLGSSLLLGVRLSSVLCFVAFTNDMRGPAFYM